MFFEYTNQVFSNNEYLFRGYELESQEKEIKNSKFYPFPIKKRSLKSLMDLPSATFTRDFSAFPFEIMPLTEEEKKNCATKNYIKFKTSYYTAWVHITDEKYVTPEHLENKDDTEGMRIARHYMWGRMNGKEAYQVELNYPNEVIRISNECNELCNREIRDNWKKYGKLGKQLLETQDKYSGDNFIKKYFPHIFSVKTIIKIFFYVLFAFLSSQYLKRKTAITKNQEEFFPYFVVSSEDIKELDELSDRKEKDRDLPWQQLALQAFSKIGSVFYDPRAFLSSPYIFHNKIKEITHR